ncbi:alpha-amylase [Candidatus Woesearchaeota archaeon]|nr:MAG: alpha-amylase [Candidatus Woesearchaeota archaeon]
MTNVCFYFQVHQPFRLRKYSLFDIGRKNDYFDERKNAEVMKKIEKKCYLPANRLIRDIISRHEGFKVAFSITGTALEQFETYSPKVLESFQELASSGSVEFLAETYHHSLSFLFSKDEFKHQVKLHQQLIKKFFKQRPKVFRNTELIYNNELAFFAEKLGFKAVLAEGWHSFLGWRSPNFVYKAKGARNVRLFLKNYKLSDDIAFRFSDKSWKEWPLTAEKFASWLSPILGDSVNLFMDYETFGEHQWKDTGIFNFLKNLPSALKKHNIGFFHPSDLLKIKPKDSLDIPDAVSWADTERDVTAWLGNKIQKSASRQLYAMRSEVLATKDEKLIDVWRKLTTSDHFYYMCTKWFADGDVHKYFNPYDNPYDCFINFTNVLQDLKLRVNAILPKKLGDL